MPRYSHLMSFMFSVESDDPHLPTTDEVREAVLQRVRTLEEYGAWCELLDEIPYDTYPAEEHAHPGS